LRCAAVPASRAVGTADFSPFLLFPGGLLVCSPFLGRFVMIIRCRSYNHDDGSSLGEPRCGPSAETRHAREPLWFGSREEEGGWGEILGIRLEKSSERLFRVCAICSSGRLLGLPRQARPFGEGSWLYIQGEGADRTWRTRGHSQFNYTSSGSKAFWMEM
jgi:hypothetical protein